MGSNVTGPSRHGKPTNGNGSSYYQAREVKPRPIGDKCNPLCPFFRCGQRALRISTEYYRGRPIKVAMCSWIGDRCIGASCRYAYCEKKAMLPDGRCAFAVERKSKKARSFEEELNEESDLEVESNVEKLAKRRL